MESKERVGHDGKGVNFIMNQFGLTVSGLLFNDRAYELEKYLKENTDGVGVTTSIRDGSTLLHLAAYYGSPLAMKVLLRLGSDPNSRDNTGKTPLIVLCSRLGDQDCHLHFEGMVNMLLETGADVNAESSNGNTPLLATSMWGTVEHVKFLLNKGSCVIYRDGSIYTPIHAAVDRGSVKIIEILVNAGMYIDVRDADGWTALLKACESSNPRSGDVVKTLLRLDADPDWQCKDGRSTLHVAVLRGDDEIAEDLLKWNVDTTLKAPYGKNRVMLTAREVAQRKGLVRLVNLIEGYEGMRLKSNGEE